MIISSGPTLIRTPADEAEDYRVARKASDLDRDFGRLFESDRDGSSPRRDDDGFDPGEEEADKKPARKLDTSSLVDPVSELRGRIDVVQVERPAKSVLQPWAGISLHVLKPGRQMVSIGSVETRAVPEPAQDHPLRQIIEDIETFDTLKLRGTIGPEDEQADTGKSSPPAAISYGEREAASFARMPFMQQADEKQVRAVREIGARPRSSATFAGAITFPLGGTGHAPPSIARPPDIFERFDSEKIRKTSALDRLFEEMPAAHAKTAKAPKQNTFMW